MRGAVLVEGHLPQRRITGSGRPEPVSNPSPRLAAARSSARYGSASSLGVNASLNLCPATATRGRWRSR
jgi:hypothetical protein